MRKAVADKRYGVIAGALLGACALAIPAWAGSSEANGPGEPAVKPGKFEPLSGPSPHASGDVLERAPKSGTPVPAPEGGAFVDRGEAPLLDHRGRDRVLADLGHFAACMNDEGHHLGEPEVGRNRVAIRLDDVTLDDEFHRAEAKCGLPTPPGVEP